MEYLELISAQLGVSVGLLTLILIWSLTWKLLGLWKSARKGSIIWFILIALFNTIGILPILYIFVFSKIKCCQTSKTKKPIKKKPVKKK